MNEHRVWVWALWAGDEDGEYEPSLRGLYATQDLAEAAQNGFSAELPWVVWDVERIEVISSLPSPPPPPSEEELKAERERLRTEVRVPLPYERNGVNK